MYVSYLHYTTDYSHKNSVTYVENLDKEKFLREFDIFDGQVLDSKPIWNTLF